MNTTNQKILSIKIKEKYLKTKQSVHHKLCLKIFIEDACLVSAGRLFQSLAPRKEKHFKGFNHHIAKFVVCKNNATKVADFNKRSKCNRNPSEKKHKSHNFLADLNV